MAKPGRKPIQIDIGQVERLAAQGLTHDQIADALGIHRETLYARKRASSDFSDAIKRGQAKGIAKVTNSLFEQANIGNTAAAIFYLKNRAGWADKIEQTTTITVADELRKRFEKASRKN